MTNEISCKFYQKHGRYPLHSFKKWGVLCNAFLAEAKRFKSGHLPKAEDYLKNGIINPSSGVNAMMVHRFFLLGQSITKESVEPLNGTLEIASSTAAILRLWEDLGSAEDENQYRHEGSYIRRYLDENLGSSMEETQENTVNMI
ncbi:hypothetical protein ACFX14_005247 [Malus domestica]